MISRLGALGLLLLTLNLSASGFVRACERHAVGVAAPATGHEHHSAPHEAGTATRTLSESACETPTTTDCCSALSSCGSGVTLDSIERRSPRIASAGDVLPSLVDGESAHAPPPELPPPKALS